jgi:cell division protein FtsB
MLEFKKKQKFRKILYSKFSILILLVLLFFAAKGAFEVYQKVRVSEGHLNLVEGQYASLEARKNSIETKINKLDTELGVEEEIRKKFNVVKEGEKVVILIDDEEEKAPEPEEEVGKIKGFWNTITSLFQ